MSSRIASAHTATHVQSAPRPHAALEKHPVQRKHPTPRKLAAVLAALTMLATGLLVSTASPASATIPAATTAERNVALTVLNLMNYQRAANHLPALGSSTALMSSARRHNVTMAQANVLSHQLPGEPVFSTRISQAGVAWHSAAENIGWSTDQSSRGADSLENAMYDEVPPEDGHRLNILSTSVHYVGIDTYIDVAHGKIWLTEDFADVSGATLTTLVPHMPFGNLDSVTALPGHKARLVGWAIDPDNRYWELAIGVYSDGHFLGWFHAPVPRPDVAAAFHAGPDQGYSIVLTLPAGLHLMTTIAANVGAGCCFTTLASHTVVV